MARPLTTPQQLTTLAALQQEPAGYVLGVSGRQLRKMTAPRNADGTYDAQALVAWWLKRQVEEAADPLLAGGASPALERWRKLRADREEIEIARLNENLVDREAIRSQLGVLATFVRRAGEQLQRECGREAHAILEETLRDFEGEVNEHFGTGDTATDGDHESG